MGQLEHSLPEKFSGILGKGDFRDNTFIDAGVRTKGDTETSLRHDRMCGSKEGMVITGGVDFEAAI